MTTQTHRVRRGETLSSIAKQYSVEVNALAKANSIKNVNYLSLNQVLIIPALRTRHPPDVPLPKPNAKNESTKGIEHDITESLDEAVARGKRIATEWLEELLQRLRTQESNESVQQENQVPVTPQLQPPRHHHESPRKKHSRGKDTLNDVKAKLKGQLGKEPHVVTFNGVKLTENEKKQIVASVAVCEMNADGFGSINNDTEFVGRKYGKRGAEVPYSRIVHIGLSYGFIQFSQDSGSLGSVLKRMQAKNPSKFLEIFGGGNKATAQSLITLTTTGRSDLVEDISIPLSGQVYWNENRKSMQGIEIKKMANSDDNKDNKSDLPIEKEIRGKRVQPIPPAKGQAAIDIWEGVWRDRFLEAGSVVDFQEAQLEEAVEKYMNPILSLVKKNKVRSALTIAFITACSIRGADRNLIMKVADKLGISLPFVSSADEYKCIDAILKGKGHVGSLKFDLDESRRAGLLKNDELGFLTEDLYDVSSYA